MDCLSYQFRSCWICVAVLYSFTYSCWLRCGVFECVISFRFYMSTFRPHHSSCCLLSVHLASGRLHITSVTMEMPFQGDTEPDIIPLVEKERRRGDFNSQTLQCELFSISPWQLVLIRFQESWQDPSYAEVTFSFSYSAEKYRVCLLNINSFKPDYEVVELDNT